jgi:hypothetical protein
LASEPLKVADQLLDRIEAAGGKQILMTLV